VLTYSDVSTEVARTGRIVLPRIQVQQCLPELLRLCRAEGVLPALRGGGPVKLSVDLVSPNPPLLPPPASSFQLVGAAQLRLQAVSAAAALVRVWQRAFCQDSPRPPLVQVWLSLPPPSAAALSPA
jgi:hypothetical protein